MTRNIAIGNYTWTGVFPIANIPDLSTLYETLAFNTGTTGQVLTRHSSGSNYWSNVGVGDLTEVQVSGGLLSVTNGTGPVPIVGLTTAVVWKQFSELQAQCYNLVPAFALSLVAIVIVSLLTTRNAS